MKSSTRAQAGFTLVELMVVLLILGILGTAATIMFRDDPARDAASEMVALLQQARRKAVAMGPVPADVATKEGSARVRVEVSSKSERNYVTFYYLLDDATWQADYPVALPQSALVYGVNTEKAATLEGAALPDKLGTGTATVDFFPNGSATPQTWYFQDRYKENGEKFRVFVMPLSGQIEASKNW